MTDEYGFKLETCSCGADLSGLEMAVTSYRDGRFPQAKCPNCGNDLLLEAPLAWPKPEPEPEPVVEPEPEPASE